MHSMKTPALLKGLVNMSALPSASQASVISATLVSGVPTARVLLPVLRLFLLPSMPSWPTHRRQRVMSALRCWLVATASAQGSSNFHFSDFVTLPHIAKVHMNLWRLGWEMFDGGCLQSSFPILAYCIWRGVRQPHVSSPFLDSWCLQTKLLVQMCLQSRMTIVYGACLPTKDWCGGFPHGLWSQLLWFVPFVSWVILVMWLYPFGP